MTGSRGDTAVIRIATRPSPQARTQAQVVADAISTATSRPCELVFVESTGDLRADVPLHQMAGQGIFIKEVQRAVLDGRADVAVHSAKDLPTAGDPGLVIGAWCVRRDPRDALVGARLGDLGAGATVATGSARRRAQLRAARPDLSFTELRGNIGTRLERIPDRGAIVMATAALEILGLTDRIAEVLDPTTFVPMVGQGCVAVEHRFGDTAAGEALGAIDDAATRHAVQTERAFLAVLGSGCSLPVGAYVDPSGTLTTFLAEADAPKARSVVMQADVSDPDTARLVAAELARVSRRELAGR
ncbi:MAG: hydroxymethylbilane synthase [Actinobacteria bacterium]|nr:hydroxymethylbilane synthase [Actinomycetota bacterium]